MRPGTANTTDTLPAYSPRPPSYHSSISDTHHSAALEGKKFASVQQAGKRGYEAIKSRAKKIRKFMQKAGVRVAAAVRRGVIILVLTVTAPIWIVVIVTDIFEW